MVAQNVLSSENLARNRQAIELINNTLMLGYSVIGKFQEAYFDLATFSCMDYVERIHNALESIKILLSVFPFQPRIETSLGLTLRASLLDFMTIVYWASYDTDQTVSPEESGQNLNNQIEVIASDQIKYTLSYLKNMKEVGYVSAIQYNTCLQNLYKNFDFLFTFNSESNEHELKHKKGISTVKMFHRIKSQPLTSKFALAYDLYMYYSKYEHHGLMTHFMQRENLNQDHDRVIYSIQYILRGYGFLLHFLNDPPDKFETEINQLSIISDEFDKLNVHK